jgi:DNA-binding transcriptional LysR family regulator
MLVGNAYLLGMLGQMELRHLRYFTTVATEQSITRAAAKLHVSQPPLSRQIRDLEDELGVRLLERGPKQVTLTPAGKIYFRDAKKILALADAATARVRAAAKNRGGELRIGYSPTVASGFLPRALQLFRAAAPQTRTQLLDLETDEMIAAVEAKKLDLALITKPHGAKWRTMEFINLFDLPIGIVVPPRHRLAAKKSVPLDEVFAEPIVAFARRGYSDYHKWLAATLKLTQLKPRLLADADGSTSLVADVEAGRGIAFGPPTLAAAHRGRIKYVPLSTPVPRIEVGMLVRKGNHSGHLSDLQRAIETAAKTKSH